MLYRTVSKIIVFLVAIFIAGCSTTDSRVVDDGEAGKTVTQTETTTGKAGQTDVVPSLAEAKEKGAAKQQPDVAVKQQPAKVAMGKDRIAQVKKIMAAKKKIEKQYEKKQRGHNPNAFYRFKRERAVTSTLIDDGVHDPTADLQDLQPPVEALKQFPKATFGNGVNWVAALNKHEINPRADQLGKKHQFTLDMNIPMKVPGTMNNVLFPHKAHTAWLACRNCHTAIFKMQRGGNPITMRKINNGQYCGVCHGKVAFPIANCNRCHSQRKQAKTASK